MKLFIYNDDFVKQWLVIKDDKPVCTFGYSKEELLRLGRFMAELIMTQTKQTLVKLEYTDTNKFIQDLGIPKGDPVLCTHANENPSLCECPADCYCQTRTCKNRRK